MACAIIPSHRGQSVPLVLEVRGSCIAIPRGVVRCKFQTVDLGTSPNGGLEIWVDGVRYTDVSLITDERLRQVFRQAVEEWDAGEWERKRDR